MIKLFTAVIFFGISLPCSQAQATHIQYVSYADVANVNLGENDTWSKTFDLVDDPMYLWAIPTHYSSNNATPDPTTVDYMGSYDPTYALHYVTLRIDPTNYTGDPTSDFLELTVNGIHIADWANPIRLYDWGVPGYPISAIYGIAANNYNVDVTLTGLSVLGTDAIAVSNVNLEGCFRHSYSCPRTSNNAPLRNWFSWS